MRDFDALRNDPELLLLHTGIRELAEKASCGQLAKTLGEIWKEAYSPWVNITVTGALNAGKSHLLNGLLGEKNLLPESALPQPGDVEITACGEGEEPYFLAGNERRPMTHFAVGLLEKETKPPYRLFIRNGWLRDEGILLREQHVYQPSAEGKANTVAEHYRRSDVLLFLVDALMAFTKQDVSFLQQCSEMGIPTLVLVTKRDLLSAEEAEGMVAYSEKFKQKLRLSFVDVADVPARIGEFTDWRAILEHRRLFFYQSAAACLMQLKEAIREKQTEVAAATAVLDRQLEEQRRQTDSQRIQWLQLEADLTAKRQVIDRQLRDHMGKNRDTVLKSLNHDLDRSNDIKAWWEKELSYRLERELLSVGGSISNVINRQIADHLKWLQQECTRLFGHPTAAPGDFVITIEDMTVQQAGLPLTDNHNLRILTRVGTVVTVIAAGTLLVTAGIGGIVLATGTLAGIGADSIIHANTKKDREKVRGELYRMVEKAELQFVADTSAKLKDTYDRIIDFLKQRQGEWQKEKIQNLQQRREEEMQRINGIDWDGLMKRTDDMIEDVLQAPGVHS
jgi:GTP-binding protein EngB required for normal cell division